MKELLVLGLVLAAAFTVAFADTTSGPCAGQGFGCYVADPNSCCNYYHCVSSGGFLMSCPPGLHFNAKLSVCDWPLRAGCNDTGGGVVTPSPSTEIPGTGPTEGPTTETTPGDGTLPIKPCVNLEPATHKVDGNCSVYIYCWQGYPYLVVCKKGEGYNETEHSCAQDDTCGSGSGSGGSGSSFTCPQQYGTYEFPGNTTRYYYCYNYVPYVVQCFTNQYYDQTIQGCALNP